MTKQIEPVAWVNDGFVFRTKDVADEYGRYISDDEVCPRPSTPVYAESDVSALLSENARLREALEEMQRAARGFASEVRRDSGIAYPWPALDIADEKARAALSAQEDA